MSQQFQIALVGGGAISRAHAAAARATGGRIQVVAVVDPNEQARRATADSAAARGFADLDALLSSADAKRVQGIVVCTPPSVRIPIVEAALKHGMHVLVEKPLAHVLSDAKTLAKLAAAHPGQVSAVGYCHRFTPAIVELKKRVSEGQIGEVSRFENTFAAPLMKMVDHWMSDPAISGGGSFIDTGCHSLDLFLHLVGQGSVRSAIFHRAWAGRGESSATVVLRSDRGIAGVIQSGWTEPARFVVTVVGTSGSLSYDYDVATELHFRPNDGPEQTIPVASHEMRFQRQLEAFADAASGGSPAIAPASFAEGLLTAQRVDEAQRLAAGG